MSKFGVALQLPPTTSTPLPPSTLSASSATVGMLNCAKLFRMPQSGTKMLSLVACRRSSAAFAGFCCHCCLSPCRPVALSLSCLASWDSKQLATCLQVSACAPLGTGRLPRPPPSKSARSEPYLEFISYFTCRRNYCCSSSSSSRRRSASSSGYLPQLWQCQLPTQVAWPQQLEELAAS